MTRGINHRHMPEPAFVHHVQHMTKGLIRPDGLWIWRHHLANRGRGSKPSSQHLERQIALGTNPQKLPTTRRNDQRSTLPVLLHVTGNRLNSIFWRANQKRTIFYNLDHSSIWHDSLLGGG